MESHTPARCARCARIRKGRRESRRKARPRQPAPWPSRPPSGRPSGTSLLDDGESFHLECVDPAGFLAEEASPPAPPTGPELAAVRGPPTRDGVVLQGVPAAPPSPSSALGTHVQPRLQKIFLQKIRSRDRAENLLMGPWKPRFSREQVLIPQAPALSSPVRRKHTESLVAISLYQLQKENLDAAPVRVSAWQLDLSWHSGIIGIAFSRRQDASHTHRKKVSSG